MQKLTFALIALLMATGCGNVVTQSATSTACQTNVVLVLVNDNFFQPLCGCQEIAGQTSPGSSRSLTCTFTAGATVIFDFTGTRQTHQIRFSNGSTLPDSPLYDLVRTPAPSTYGFLVSSAGTYSFYDSINPTLTGSLVAL